MAEVIIVNGIRICKYFSAKVKGILGFAEDDRTLSIMCGENTSDEECIKYVYANFHDMLFSKKKNAIKREREKDVQKKKKVESLDNRQKPLVSGGALYDPMTDPRNPFSTVVPKVEATVTTKRLSNKELEILVRRHRGYHIQYKFICNLCRNTHIQGCEYSDDRGHRYVICDICRGELLNFKGWIHEIPANIGHGKK